MTWIRNHVHVLDASVAEANRQELDIFSTEHNIYGYWGMTPHPGWVWLGHVETRPLHSQRLPYKGHGALWVWLRERRAQVPGWTCRSALQVPTYMHSVMDIYSDIYALVFQKSSYYAEFALIGDVPGPHSHWMSFILKNIQWLISFPIFFRPPHQKWVELCLAGNFKDLWKSRKFASSQERCLLTSESGTDNAGKVKFVACYDPTGGEQTHLYIYTYTYHICIYI